MKLRSIFNRLYSDYLMPSRLPELMNLYNLSLSEGYEIHSVISFWDVINQGLDPEKKYLISRHDIDTDLLTTLKIFNLEQSLKIKSSFYFRLNTLDYGFMKEVEASGSEASYHFEEIATLAKRYKWKESNVDFELAREEFKRNFNLIKENTQLPLRSVCSHGDFMNRKLKIVNHALLNDELRKELKIEIETYDDEFMKHVDSRHSDTLHPIYYNPSAPHEAIKQGVPVIYLLTHPRHWNVNRIENTKDNVRRVWEGLRYIF